MHSDYTLLMSMALDDEATPDEVQRLREHVRTCAACAGIWERWQVVDRRFDAAPLVTPPATFTDAVMARIETRSVERRRTYRFGSGLALTWLAASFLSLALLGLLLYWGAQNPGQVSGIFFAILKGLGMAAWILLGFLRLLGGIGAPTLAAYVGLLATLTCLFSMLWLWVISRGDALETQAASAG